MTRLIFYMPKLLPYLLLCVKAPVVRLWDALTGKLLMQLPRFHERGVSQLAFSADEKWLASVGQDQNHTIATYEWER